VKNNGVLKCLFEDAFFTLKFIQLKSIEKTSRLKKKISIKVI